MPVTPFADQRRVCFAGDSFVQGIGDPAGCGWVGRITARALERGHDVSAFNLGIRHQTSVEIARRWESECAPRLIPETRNHVVFSFGTNDVSMANGVRRVPQQTSIATLASLLAHAAALELSILMIGPPPTLDAERNRAAAALSEDFAACCRERGVPYLDVFHPLAQTPLWTRELAAGDGAHPGAKGYELLTGLIDTWPAWWFGARA